MSEVEADHNSAVDRLPDSEDEAEDSVASPVDSDSDTDEDSETENYTPLTLEQVQELLGRIDHPDDTIRGEVFLKLCNFIKNQKKFAAENSDKFDIPKLVETFEKSTNEDVPSPIICLLALLAPCSSVARQIIAPFVPIFLAFIKQDDYLNLAQLFEIIKELVTKEGRPNIVRSLALQLCDEDPDNIAKADLLLNAFSTESLKMKKLLQDAFHNVLSDESVSLDTISKLVRGLNCSSPGTRRASLDAGFCNFFVQKLDTTAGEDLEKYLGVFDESLEAEQMVRADLASNQDHLQRFIRVLDHESHSIRILSASILGKCLEGYLGERSKPSPIMEELKRPEALAAIRRLIRSGVSTLTIAGLNLLSDALVAQQLSESWDTGDDGTTPFNPWDDEKALQDFLTYVVGLFGQKDKPVVTAVLRLLGQVCWFYPRGKQSTRLAFEAVTPTADASFFSILDADWGGGLHGRRQLRHVQAVAAAGGGIARMESLLKHMPETVKEIRTLLEGYAALLSGDEVDPSPGRTNPHLPVLVARMLREGGEEELEVVRWIIRRLHEDGNPEVFSSWTDLATKEVVDSLIAFVNIQPQPFERPEQGEMPQEEFQAIERVYDEKAVAEAVRIQSIQFDVRMILGDLVALLKPLAPTFIGALLRWAVRSLDDDVFNLLKLYTSTSNDGGITEALRQAVKELAASDPAPSLSTYNNLIASGGALTLALYQEGFAEEIIGYFGSDKEDEIDPREAVLIIETFLRNLQVDEDKLVIKKAFFDHKPIIDHTLNTIVSADKDNLDWGFDSTARALGLLVTGFPDGLAIISTPKLYDALLSHWDSPQLLATNVAPLLSLVSQQDPSKLAALVQQQIGILKVDKRTDYEVKLTKESACECLTALAITTPSARQLLIEGGLLAYVSKSLKSSLAREREYGFDLLAALAKDGDSTPAILDAVAPELQTLAHNFANEIYPMVPNLRLAALYIPSRVSDLIEANYHRVVLKTLFRLWSFDDVDLLLLVIEGIVASGVGYGLVAEAIKQLLEEEGTYEELFGYSHAFRQLLYRSPKCAKATVDGGAVDYAIKLLGHDSLFFATKAAALVADLARSTDVDCRTRLVDLGAIGLIETLLGRLKPATEVDLEALDLDERKSYNTTKKYVSVVEQSLLLVKGEDVPGYKPDFYL